MSMTIAATMGAPQARTTTAQLPITRLFALLMLIFLAACQSVIPKGGQGPEGPPPVVTPDPGNVVAGDNDRHRVALLLPITGPDGDVGQSIANATTLALLDTRNTNIRMTTYDTALGVDAAARKAVADGNKLILGPLRSDDVVAVANVATPAKVPVISFSNDIGAAGKNVFLMGHLPNQSIDRVVKYAKGQGLMRFGGIVSKDVYGQRALSNITNSVRTVGGTLVSIQEIDGSTASIEAATKKLAAAGAVDAVLIADSGRVAIATVPVLRKNGVKTAKILGTDRWDVDTTLSANAGMRGAWFASVPDAQYQKFAGMYRTRFGTSPLRISSLGYDSVLLVARVAQNWKIGSSFPVGRLTDPEGFVGVDGAFRFFANGQSERMLEVQEVQAGKYVIIEPAPSTFILK
jgi:ABC-type branched-subunit amino acid transport system substrate-binding protein